MTGYVGIGVHPCLSLIYHPVDFTEKKIKKQLATNLLVTLPETNIAPENGWLEYYFPIGEASFQGLC